MVYSDDEPSKHYYIKITNELARDFQEFNQVISAQLPTIYEFLRK